MGGRGDGETGRGISSPLLYSLLPTPYSLLTPLGDSTALLMSFEVDPRRLQTWRWGLAYATSGDVPLRLRDCGNVQ